MRINRFLASAGVASRRKAEKYILDGRVAVNGQTVVDLATTVTPSEDRVTLDGKPLQIEKKVHYLLNKPKGYVTTNKDELGRKTVFELVPPAADRLFAAGRLDVRLQRSRADNQRRQACQPSGTSFL
ncbi:MAG: S4 domain-containing protein [Planctomycetota bacterium]|nr:S4 domain-containing protein [Planctomycetota bacterium]